MTWPQFYAYYEDAAWQRSPADMRGLQRQYEEVMRVVAEDPGAKTWLAEWAAAHATADLPMEIPDEAPGVQAAMDRWDAGPKAPEELEDVRESGEHDSNGEPVMEYLAVMPNGAAEEKRTWMRQKDLARFRRAWGKLRAKAQALRDRPAQKRWLPAVFGG